MSILSRIFSTAAAGVLTKSAQGLIRELPQTEVYKLLWSYYLNNGLYDTLREQGYRTDDTRLKALRNPAQRAVEFYADTLFPGTLSHALPIDTENTRLEDAIKKLWNWSNWGQRKQVAVRWGAIMGDVYIKVAQPDQGERVILQLLDPMTVTDRTADERGYLTYLRIDVPRAERIGDEVKVRTYTEIWDLTGVRTWTHQHGQAAEVGRLGEPALEVPLSAWGIDFVPVVHIMHKDIGDEYGVGAFHMALEKIDELALMATRLHSMIFRHNDVTWALAANSLDATGRPIPPPRIGDRELGTSDTVEMGGERMIRLPGMASITPLVPQLNYSAHLEAISAQVNDLMEDLPELLYYQIRELSDMSGKAIRLTMGPAIKRAEEARGNHESGLIRAHKMALTIGKAMKVWDRDPGSYEKGDFEHEFSERPIMSHEREETAAVVKTEVESGIPLATALLRSGWSREEIEEMEAELEKSQTSQQTGLAQALQNAAGAFQAGAADNGVSQLGNNLQAPF